MKYKYDLHLHSDWSDGDYSLAEISKIAKENGLRGLAITDHNVIASENELNKFKKECQKKSIETFEGIEITTNYGGVDIHVLGYSLKFNKKILRNGLKKTISGYVERWRKTSQKLEKFFNLKINFEKIRKERGIYKFLTRFDVIKAFQKDTAKNINELIALTIRKGIAYVPYGHYIMSPFEALKLIKKADGIAIMAHPLTPERSNFPKEKTKKIITQLIKKLKDKGLAGVEVFYPLHTKKQEKTLLNLAKKNNLLITGGSDWHGEKNKPAIKIGMAGLNKKQFTKFKNYLKKSES